ncbi:MAG: MFS transporter [Ktedonobacterales bacterium]
MDAHDSPPPGTGRPTGEPPREGWLRRVRRLATLDMTPLRRHRDFRLLFAGQLVTVFGSMMTAVALPYQAYTLTHSPLAVGLFGIAQLVPILLLAFVGGALADAFDRRRLVRMTELALAVLSGVLLVNALLPHPQLWLLYVVAALMAGLDALQRPSLDALLPRLVEHEELAAAGALGSLRSTFAMILAPAVAGLVIAVAGLPSTYGMDVVTFIVSLLALRLMRAVPPPPDAERPSVRRVVEGLRYARSRPELLGTYLVDIVAMFFGMPTALFPALAVQYAHDSAGLAAGTALGLLYTAPAVGAFLASATSGWSGRIHRHGMAVILAAGAWGLAITAVGLAPSLPLAFVFLAFAGGADMVSGLFRGVIWNKTVPDALRGRLASIEMVSYTSGPLLGDVESGAVASAFTPRISILSGGVLCVLGVGLLALALPRFRAYDDRHVAAIAAIAASPPQAAEPERASV